MMGLQQAMILAVAFIQVSYASHCCHPDRLQGVAYLVEHQKQWSFAIDFPHGLFYNDQGMHGNMNVFDFINNKWYHRDDDSCSVMDHEGESQSTQCLTEDQHVGTFKMGHGHDEKDVDVFQYMLDGHMVRKTVAVHKGVCIPLFLTRTANGFNETYVFTHVQPFIDQFDTSSISLDDCQPHTEQHDGKYKRAYADHEKRDYVQFKRDYVQF